MSPDLHLVSQVLLEADQDPMIDKVKESFQTRKESIYNLHHLQIPHRLLKLSLKMMKIAMTLSLLILYLVTTLVDGLVNRMLARRLIMINLYSQNIMLVLKLIKEMDRLEEQRLLMERLK